jgi:serralysin
MVVGVDVNTGHVMGRMYFASGSPDGGLFQISDVPTGLLASTSPSLAVLPDGTIIVEWTTNENSRLDTKTAVFDPRETGLNASGTSLGDDWVGSKFADRVQLGNGNDRFTDLGGSDVVFGEAGRDTLLGGDGNDFLYGGAADDTLTGSANDDHLFGGLGADVLDGGAGFDLARYDDANHGNLFIDMGGILQSGAALGDTYFEIEGIVGGLGNDFIIGNSAANLLRGGGGADSINGQGGRDTLDGGTGNDTLSGFDGGGQRLIGGTGIDIASYYDGVTSTNFTIRLDNPSLNTGAAAGDTYSGIEGIQGSQGKNTIIGNSSANILIGDFGNDTIIGGGGKDVLTGDFAGVPITFADRFVYRSVSETGKTASTRDVITDFVHNNTLSLSDRIDLSLIDASTKAGGNQAFTFIARSAFNGTAGQLHYKLENNAGTLNDKTIIEGDINGDRRADFQIELTGIKSLVAADFLL